MKHNRSILRVMLLGVFFLPSLVQAQGKWTAAGEGAVKIYKEVNGNLKYSQKIGTAVPRKTGTNSPISGELNRAIAEVGRVSKIGMEEGAAASGKVAVKNSLAVNQPATHNIKSLEQMKKMAGNAPAEVVQKPATDKITDLGPTKYYSRNSGDKVQIPSRNISAQNARALANLTKRPIKDLRVSLESDSENLLLPKSPETILKAETQTLAQGENALENATAYEGIKAPADFSDKEAVKAWLRRLSEASEQGVQQAKGNELWQTQLITAETNPEIKKIFQELFKDLAKSQKLVDTAAAQKRLQDAQAYLRSLTPQQANDLKTLYSASFRQHAMAIRSPQATQYGYFLQGSNMKKHYEYMLTEDVFGIREGGYIPTVIGDPADGVSKRQISEMIRLAEKTDKPIFVFLDMHGGVKGGHFVALANNHFELSTADIVEYMHNLRIATQTPELNLYMTSCHGGAFLDEFEVLPLAQREGINVFVSTSAQQCNYVTNTRSVRTHVEGKEIVKEMVEDMLRQILENGNYYAQANINGQSFNPLQIAMERARAIGDNELFESLEIESRFQKEKKSGASAFFKLFDKGFFADEMKQYFIGYATKEKADALFGETIKDGKFDFFEEMLKRNFADQYGFDFNSEMMQWNKKFKINRPDRSLEEYEQSIWDDIDF